MSTLFIFKRRSSYLSAKRFFPYPAFNNFSHRLSAEGVFFRLLNGTPAGFRHLSTSNTRNMFRTLPQVSKRSLSPRKEAVMDFMHVLVSGSLVIGSIGLIGYFIYLVSSGIVKKRRLEHLINEGIIKVETSGDKVKLVDK